MLMQQMIDAIRADATVGCGSCSVVDECYEDAELAAALAEAGVTTLQAAKAWAHNADRLFREREQEVADLEEDARAQSDLDRHNAEFDAWESMNDRERDTRINEAI